MKNIKENINLYMNGWKNKGYSKDIPDEVPDVLMNLQLAPSYKAIALCILRNDHAFKGLGFSEIKSEWYNILKREELGKEKRAKHKQLSLF